MAMLNFRGRYSILGDLLQKHESASRNSHRGKGQIRTVGKLIKIRRKVLSSITSLTS